MSELLSLLTRENVRRKNNDLEKFTAPIIGYLLNHSGLLNWLSFVGYYFKVKLATYSFINLQRPPKRINYKRKLPFCSLAANASSFSWVDLKDWNVFLKLFGSHVTIWMKIGIAHSQANFVSDVITLEIF